MIDNITESKLHVALSVFPFSSSQAVRASLTRTAHLQKLFTLDTLHFCVFASCISDFNLAEFYKWIYFYMIYSQQIQGRSSILKLQLCNLLLVTRWPLGCEFRPPFPSLCSSGITDSVHMDRWGEEDRQAVLTPNLISEAGHGTPCTLWWMHSLGWHSSCGLLIWE